MLWRQLICTWTGSHVRFNTHDLLIKLHSIGVQSDWGVVGDSELATKHDRTLWVHVVLICIWLSILNCYVTRGEYVCHLAYRYDIIIIHLAHHHHSVHWRRVREAAPTHNQPAADLIALAYSSAQITVAGIMRHHHRQAFKHWPNSQSYLGQVVINNCRKSNWMDGGGLSYLLSD